MSLKLPKKYRPSANESYMNEMQQEYFRRKLVAWRNELLEDYAETLEHMGDSAGQIADYVDLANHESERSLEMHTRNRERKLIGKIDEALERLRDGTYGYCVETGKPIGLARLEARPTAALSIEAQESHEKRERIGPFPAR